MLSVNQIMAQIKMTEIWKCKNVTSYPLHPTTIQPIHNGTTTRGASSEKFKLNSTPNTFIGDATRLWNLAPESVINSKNLKNAKMCVKAFCSTMPI